MIWLWAFARAHTLPNYISNQRLQIIAPPQTERVGLTHGLTLCGILGCRTFIGPNKEIAQKLRAFEFVNSEHGLNIGAVGDILGLYQSEKTSSRLYQAPSCTLRLVSNIALERDERAVQEHEMMSLNAENSKAFWPG
jgi:hypothetical protein